MTKLRLRNLIVFCLSLICVSASVNAQKRTVTEPPTTKPADAESRSLRNQQLVFLHENLLSRTLDSIKKMDEVALRVSARSQLLAYLWENKTLSDRHLSLKKNLALYAIDDLSNHYPEIPQFMLDYLSADLAALIEKHQPDLIEKLQAAKAKAKSGKQAADIRSLFELKNGDLTTKDENAAIPLVDQIHKSDLRTFALIGLLSGLSDLLAKAKD